MAAAGRQGAAAEDAHGLGPTGARRDALGRYLQVLEVVCYICYSIYIQTHTGQSGHTHSGRMHTHIYIYYILYIIIIIIIIIFIIVIIILYIYILIYIYIMIYIYHDIYIYIMIYIYIYIYYDIYIYIYIFYDVICYVQSTSALSPFFLCLFTYRPGCREVQAQDGCGRGPANPWRKRVAKWEKSWFNNG